MIHKNLHSITLERRALGGLIKYPHIYVDISSFAHHEDFFNSVNESIFIVASQRIEKKLKCESTLIAQDIVNIGIKTKDDIDIFDYIESLIFSQISAEGAKEAFKELSALRVKRDLAANLKNALDYVYNSSDKPLDEVISNTDRLYHDEIKVVLDIEKPVDVFEDIESLVFEKAKNPVEDIGFLTPFEEFNKMNGGFRPSNLYAIVSRPGQGKTNWLMEMSFGTALRSNFKIKVLYLDTENETQDVKFRMLASLTGVPYWFLETGNWASHAEYKPKVESGLKLIKSQKYSFCHYKVGNKSIDQVCSFVRRWHSMNVGRGEDCLIVYDYVKLTTEKIEKNWAEYQAIGEKIDKLKKLAEELKAAVISAMQLNKTGDSFGKKSNELVDDSTAISLSDRLQWFASYVGLFRTKTIDEIEWDGTEYGTHKLIKLKGRFQGKEAMGHNDMIKRKINGKSILAQNYINYSVNNFRIEERGSLRTMLEGPSANNKNEH